MNEFRKAHLEAMRKSNARVATFLEVCLSMTESGTSLVDSVESLEDVVFWLCQHRHDIALDIEGVELCRRGRVSLIQICTVCSYPRKHHILLIDIAVMDARAFDPVCDALTGQNEISLRAILQDNKREKIIFDGRVDADAMFHLYGVH